MTESTLHRRVSVDTPEHVRINYVLSDLGSRAAAFAIDVGLLAAANMCLVMALYWTDRLGAVAESLSATILIFALFFVQAGYFMLFEGLGGGRTPGKRVLGLRVIHAGGEPLSFRGSVLRNLLRVVDLQPGPSGLAGAASVLVTKRAQRLGDLVADTIVVRDAGGSEALGADQPPPARVGRPTLTPAQFDLLAGYMARRESLDGEVRARVAKSVLDGLGPALERLGPELRPHASASSRDATAAAGSGAPEAAHGEDKAPPAPTDPDATLKALHAHEAPRHAARRGGANLQAATMARRQREAWARYVALVEKGTKRGLRTLTEAEVRDFGRLYRGLAADLARARTYGASPGLLGTVQRWVGSGHNLLYRARGTVAVAVGHWLAAEFPRAVRLHRIPVLLSAGLLFGSATATYVATHDDPLMARAIAGPGMMTRAENTDKGDPDTPYLLREMGAEDMPVLSARLMTNNIGVTFTAFAGGLLAGVGTLLIMLLNGILLGGVAGAYANEGVLGVLLAFVFPHGFIELGAICIAGGAGFGLGSAILVPGRLTRAEALRQRGRSFLTLVVGSAAMLVVAGVVEGSYSPSALPAVAKFAFGTATAALLLAYFGLAGRQRVQVSKNPSPTS